MEKFNKGQRLWRTESAPLLQTFLDMTLCDILTEPSDSLEAKFTAEEVATQKDLQAKRLTLSTVAIK